MKLYLISQDSNMEYDTYDSAVVCADTPEQARLTHPNGCDDWEGEHEIYGPWCDAKDVNVEEIGLAHPNMVKGVIMASFKAG